MFSTCMPTVHVSDVDSSVRFYTEVLGLKLAERYGNHWASVQAGSVKIGLHPASAQNPAGRNGSITMGFAAVGVLEEIVRKLEARGVSFPYGIQKDEGGKFALFPDPDGHSLFLYEITQQEKAGDLEAAPYQQALEPSESTSR
jgi:catechol 2,3-dioxygenase-like lactoylglutathione lyase family enzyme